MDQRRLGQTGPLVTPLGYGAFKIGRNQQTKYAATYDLPSDAEVDRLLNGVLDLGLNYIDTAPAYGLSEERIGHSIGHRRNEFTLSTKVGESFDGRQSTYDFSESAITASVQRSLRRLKTDVLDLVFIHSHADDIAIIKSTDAVPTLQRLREQGVIRQLGFSAKSLAGARTALAWADVLMLEFHLDDRTMEPVIMAAAAEGIGIVVKKALASGRLSAHDALRFVTGFPGVTTTVTSTLNLGHLRSNLEAIRELR